MCSIKTPRIPPAPVYATPPSNPEPEPVFDAEDKNLSGDTANVRAKRRGARALRTDLGIGADQPKTTSLGIPS